MWRFHFPFMGKMAWCWPRIHVSSFNALNLKSAIEKRRNAFSAQTPKFRPILFMWFFCRSCTVPYFSSKLWTVSVIVSRRLQNQILLEFSLFHGLITRYRCLLCDASSNLHFTSFDTGGSLRINISICITNSFVQVMTCFYPLQASMTSND